MKTVFATIALTLFAIVVADVSELGRGQNEYLPLYHNEQDFGRILAGFGPPRQYLPPVGGGGGAGGPNRGQGQGGRGFGSQPSQAFAQSFGKNVRPDQLALPSQDENPGQSQQDSQQGPQQRQGSQQQGFAGRGFGQQQQGGPRQGGQQGGPRQGQNFGGQRQSQNFGGPRQQGQNFGGSQQSFGGSGGGRGFGQSNQQNSGHTLSADGYRYRDPTRRF